MFILLFFSISNLWQLWEKRCRLLCCCFVDQDEQYINAVSDIAELFAAELQGDFVASDIAVGLVLLQQEQEANERQHRAMGEVTGLTISGTK